MGETLALLVLTKPSAAYFHEAQPTKIMKKNSSSTVRGRCARLALLAVLALTTAIPQRSSAQDFTNYPAGDDITTSMGQFQIQLDQRWVKIFDVLITNSPLSNLTVTRRKGTRLYKKGGTLTSPTLFDFNTQIGRSDPFVIASPEKYVGALAGSANGRTYVRDPDLVVHPVWPIPSTNGYVIHTFLKSVNMTDQLTTHLGFSVRAGMAATNRPVCVGQVEAGPNGGFPANSFFNVYAEIHIPGGGLMSSLDLVNVEPLLVQKTNVISFPPHVVYQHENSEAVPVYFNTNTVIYNPLGGTNIFVQRGELFGQLQLAGHGAAFTSAEVESFQVEFENESATNTMPANPAPTNSVVVHDYHPDYDAKPRALRDGKRNGSGQFQFTVQGLVPGTTNYLQKCDGDASQGWETIATFVPTTNTFTFSDSAGMNRPNRLYRLSLLP